MVIYMLLYRDYVIVSSELLIYAGSPHQVVIEDFRSCTYTRMQ